MIESAITFPLLGYRKTSYCIVQEKLYLVYFNFMQRNQYELYTEGFKYADNQGHFILYDEKREKQNCSSLVKYYGIVLTNDKLCQLELTSIYGGQRVKINMHVLYVAKDVDVNETK